jgi:hypothetical protein
MHLGLTLGLAARRRGGGAAAGAYTAAYAANSINPELVADFASGFYAQDGAASTFADLFTFSRASAATYVDSNGVLQTASSGVARTGHHKWNGSAWVNKGIFREPEARTNLITHSENFGSDWVNSNVAINAAATNSPSGAADATRLTATATSGIHSVHQSFNPSGAVAHTFSVYAKPDATANIGILILEGTANGVVHKFDLSDGSALTDEAIGVGLTVVNKLAEYAGNGYYRVSSTVVAAGTAQHRAYIYVLASDGSRVFAGDGESVFVYGAQLEAVSNAAPYASSYIPTSGATATRAAETLSIAGAKMPSYTTAVSIAMAGELSISDNDSWWATLPFLWGEYFDTNYLLLRGHTNGTAGKVALEALLSGNSNANSTPPNSERDVGVSVPYNASARYLSNYMALALEGEAHSPNTNTAPTGLPDLSETDLLVGYNYTGTIEKVVVWGADIGDTGIEEASA